MIRPKPTEIPSNASYGTDRNITESIIFTCAELDERSWMVSRCQSLPGADGFVRHALVVFSHHAPGTRDESDEGRVGPLAGLVEGISHLGYPWFRCPIVYIYIYIYIHIINSHIYIYIYIHWMVSNMKYPQEISNHYYHISLSRTVYNIYIPNINPSIIHQHDTPWYSQQISPSQWPFQDPRLGISEYPHKIWPEIWY